MCLFYEKEKFNSLSVAHICGIFWNPTKYIDHILLGTYLHSLHTNYISRSCHLLNVELGIDSHLCAYELNDIGFSHFSSLTTLQFYVWKFYHQYSSLFH